MLLSTIAFLILNKSTSNHMITKYIIRLLGWFALFYEVSALATITSNTKKSDYSLSTPPIGIHITTQWQMSNRILNSHPTSASQCIQI